MKIIALLPMKGNSERVPNKNLKDFAGNPLYHHIMKTLLESKYIDKVVVNTDSTLIEADIKKSFGKTIVINNRPPEIIGDTISMNEIIKYDLKCFEADIYLQTHSTNPLLKKESIDLAIEKMIGLKNQDIHDSIFSVTRLQTRLYRKNGKPLNHNPNELLRTQDLEPLFEENSNFYLFTKKSFELSGGKRIGRNPLMFEVDKIEAIDIDEPEDFVIAETLFKIFS